ncbi:unnamed protein product, partial [Amoebophrya sp. A25]
TKSKTSTSSSVMGGSGRRGRQTVQDLGPGDAVGVISSTPSKPGMSDALDNT